MKFGLFYLPYFKTKLTSLLFWVLPLIIGTSFVGCAKKSIGYMRTNRGMPVVAWNEDTVNTAYIYLYDSGEFDYRFVNRSISTIKRNTYRGEYKIHQDSLFLQYKWRRKPKNLTTYLTLSVGATHWIQWFQNSEKGMFLRIQSRLSR